MALKCLNKKTLSELQKLYFHAKKLSEQTTKGQYRSAFRGQGMEFEEVREYTPGDDVRAIDWKVTARTGMPFVKLYREERELSVVIAADISKSTVTAKREELIAEVGAVLTMIALKNNDRVGLALFGAEVRSFYPPKKNRSSGWRILREVMEAERLETGTNIKKACDFLMSTLKTRSVIFLVSDFIDEGFESSLSRLGRRHDVTVIRIHDKADLAAPPPCIVNVKDPETGVSRSIDYSSKAARESFVEQNKLAKERISSFCSKSKISFVDLKAGSDFMPELAKMFSER